MDRKMITLSVDGKTVTVPEGTRILDACKVAGIKVPSLCYLEDVSAHGSCGICVVEIEGFRRLVRYASIPSSRIWSSIPTPTV